jgi:hypothetical protein
VCVITHWVLTDPRRIWEEAAEKARQELVREERERVERLKVMFASKIYVQLQPFAVQAYSACLKLTSPLWSFLHGAARDLTINFAVHIDTPRIVIDVLAVERVSGRTHRTNKYTQPN